jgi:hypothetical protein
MKLAEFPEAALPRIAFHEYVYSEPSLALMFASKTAYIEHFLCTSKSTCPGVVAGSNCEENDHEHRGQ